jgi:Family of unknown function (DUF5691)
MDELETPLTQVRSAWMAGRSAVEHCPPEWRAAAEGPDAECALVALTGHAAAVLFRPAPPAPLEPRPLLPRLALPSVPEAVRPRLRRVLARKELGQLERPLIDLVAARGFAMHPADWLPSRSDDWVPDLYAPWLDWVRAESKAAPASAFDLESYDQYSWTERRAALAALRERDPAAARAIIAAKAASEPAERRVRLVEILEVRLSADDGTFLESLASDRSDRVRALASAYLARLGWQTDTDALAAELAEMVQIGKVGLVQRRTQLTIKPLKTGAQHARRQDLFKLVSFAGLVRALGVSEQQILETFPTGTVEGVEAFVQMVAVTGSDDARRALFDLMLDDAAPSLAHARPLAPRLSVEERRALLPRLMKRDTDAFETTLALMGRTLGEASLSALLASPGYAQLMSMVETATRADETAAKSAGHVLAAMLDRVALLVDAAAAAALIARLTTAGLSPADPKLDMLHLNATLVPEKTS